MTSKEVVRELIEKAIHNCDDWDFVRLYTIEKDLEVLEILKRSICDKERCQYTFKKKGKVGKVMIMALTIKGADIKQIKEWLENGE